jgi:hypothetical protein
MTRLALPTLCAVLAAGALASAQIPGTASREAAPEVQRYVAIGCVSKAGTAAAPRYLITDKRGDQPETYRLQGDAAVLEQHVGHTLEVSGPITTPASGTTPATLKVDSLVWLASSCAK